MQDFSGAGLTSTEEQILNLLNSKIGECVPINEFYSLAPDNHKRLQGWDFRIHITSLRKKISSFGHEIKNVRGKGYELISVDLFEPFESWYISKFLNVMGDAKESIIKLRNEHGGYDDPHIDGAWEAWKR